MFRKPAERIARYVTLRRRLPVSLGRRPLYVTPDAALSYARFDLEKAFSDLFYIAKEWVSPGDSVWDVGANVGLFTMAAAHQAGKTGSVLAVEADPRLSALIQRSANLRQNSDLAISTLTVAAAAELGIAAFSIAERGRASSSLSAVGHRSQAGGSRYEQAVLTVSLDFLLKFFRPPDVLKIDVEGAEALVLAGAVEVLESARPAIYVEVGDRHRAEISQQLTDLDYQLFDASGGGLSATPICTYNTLALPRERVD